MKKTTIIPAFQDERGKISDIFYKVKIDHIGVIDSVKGSIRGNHYHQQSIQHTYITKGKMEYWYKKLDSDEEAKCVILNEYDMATSEPGEIHAMRMLEDNQFIVFTEGIRGGFDYDKDTFKVPSIIPE